MPEPTKPASEETPKGEESKAKQPTMISIPVHGEDRELPIARVQELAVKGMDHDAREADLSQREAKLTQNSRGYGDFLALQDALTKAPGGRGVEALDLIIRDASGVVERYHASAGPGGEAAEEPSEDGTTPQVDQAELVRLRAETDRLAQRVAASESRTAAASLETTLRSKLALHPWLVGPEGKLNRKGELAYRQVVAVQASNPNASLEASVTIAADDVRKAMEDDKAGAVARQHDREKLQTVDPGKGLGMPALDKPMTKESFNDGSLHKQAIAAAVSMGIPLD